MVSSQSIDPVNVQPDWKLEIFFSLWHGCPCCSPPPPPPVACATFSPRHPLIISHLHGAFCFYKSCPVLVLLYFMCVMSSGASLLQGVPSCVVRQNDLVETQQGVNVMEKE